MFRVIRTNSNTLKVVEMPYILAAGESVEGYYTFANQAGAEHYKMVLESR